MQIIRIIIILLPSIGYRSDDVSRRSGQDKSVKQAYMWDNIVQTYNVEIIEDLTT
jgi:hypothetical protein